MSIAPQWKACYRDNGIETEMGREQDISAFARVKLGASRESSSMPRPAAGKAAGAGAVHSSRAPVVPSKTVIHCWLAIVLCNDSSGWPCLRLSTLGSCLTLLNTTNCILPYLPRPHHTIHFSIFSLSLSQPTTPIFLPPPSPTEINMSSGNKVTFQENSEEKTDANGRGRALSGAKAPDPGLIRTPSRRLPSPYPHHDALDEQTSPIGSALKRAKNTASAVFCLANANQTHSDEGDESLQRYKASLGLTGGNDLSDPNDPRVCIIQSLTMESPGRPPVVIDLSAPGSVDSLKKTPFKIKEGVTFTMSAQFKVQHEILSGLHYVQVIKRKNITIPGVGKSDEMIVSFFLMYSTTQLQFC